MSRRNHANWAHETRNRMDDSRRAQSASYLHEAQRCRHPFKKLMADGNSYWCDPCKRIVGFVHLPTKRKPT